MRIYRWYNVFTTFSNVGSMLLMYATLIQRFYNVNNVGTTLLQRFSENAKIVGPTDRTGQNIKRSDAHDDRVRPIVRIRLIHCTRSFHSVTLTDMKI